MPDTLCMDVAKNIVKNIGLTPLKLEISIFPNPLFEE